MHAKDGKYTLILIRKLHKLRVTLKWVLKEYGGRVQNWIHLGEARANS